MSSPSRFLLGTGEESNSELQSRDHDSHPLLVLESHVDGRELLQSMDLAIVRVRQLERLKFREREGVVLEEHLDRRRCITGRQTDPRELPALGLPPALVRDTTAVVFGTSPVPQAVVTLTEGVLSMMRFAHRKLIALGLIRRAGGPRRIRDVHRPGPAPRTSQDGADRSPGPPEPEEPADDFPLGGFDHGVPDLDTKSLEDLVLKCPKTLGGKADPLGPEKIPLGPNDPALLQLQKAKLNAALADLTLILERCKDGNQLSAALTIPEACNRAVAAASDVFSGNELRPWLEERVRIAKWYEKVVDAQMKAGRRTVSELNAARYARLEAEIALLKLTTRK